MKNAVHVYCVARVLASSAWECVGRVSSTNGGFGISSRVSYRPPRARSSENLQNLLRPSSAVNGSL